MEVEMETPPSRKSRIGRLSKRFERSTSSLIFSRSFTSLTSSNLCRICQRLRFQQLREDKPFFHGKPDEIIASARSGCPFCNLLHQNFDLGPETLQIRLVGIRRRLSLQEKASLVEEGDIEAIRVLNGYDRDIDNPFSHKLALYTTYDDVAATSIKRRPFLENFDSDESFRLIKSWLDTCVFHHPGCNSSLISQLPTRIIDVGMRGGQQDPLLFTPPKGYKDSYIALSYCWGTAETKFVLSKENSQLPKLTFPLAKLPKTLRDAIRITQRLGFRFLWVDALCIIQEGDDGEDFLRESATMHEVYGNATLTIAAAAAKNVYEGIFQTPRRDPHPSCKVAYDLPDGTIGTAFVEFEEVDKGGSRLNEPLNTRGWTFQERILSPRVVLFYRDEMSWDCASTLINSNGPLNPTINHNQDSPGRYSDYIVSRAPLSTDQLSEREAYMAYWRTLIAFYSRRTLTNPSDKLRAIAGLAELIKSKTGDSYVTGSGSWQSDLAYQTCWISIELRLQPDPKWDAPSWAWTSCCGKVQFLPVVDVASIESAPSLDSDGSLKINGWIKSWDGAFVGSYDGLGIIHSTPFPFDWNELEMRSLGIVFDREREVEEFFINRSQSGSFLFYPRFIYSGFFVLLLKKTGYFYRRVGVYDFKPRAPGWLVDFSTSSFGDIIIK